MSVSNRGKSITNIFWKIIPFLITGCLLLQCLQYRTDDPTYWIFFLVVFLCLFPFFVAMSYVLQMFIKGRLWKSKSGTELIDPEVQKLRAKAGKWTRITLLTWACAFLIIAFIAIKFKIIENEGHLIKEGQPATLSEGSRAHAILSFLDTFVACLWPIPLITIVFGAILFFGWLLHQKRTGKKQTGIFWKIALFGTIACFVTPILLTGVLGGSMKVMTRNQVKAFLNNVSPNAVVEINNQQVENKEEVIKELAKVSHFMAQHSCAGKKFHIAIKDDNEGLVIYLHRYSPDHQEYWVFYPGYRFTSSNEIGRVTTDLFDNF